MSSRTPPAGLVLALVLVQVLFGVHYYAAKAALTILPPLALVCLRITGATVILLPLALILGRRRGLPGGTDLLRLAGLAVLGIVVNQIFFVEGLSRTTLSHSSLINCSIPVFTLLLALVLGHERAAPLKLASIAASLGGVLILLRADQMVWDSMARGDLLTLVNAFSFSLFLVLSRPLLARLDALVATGILFAFAALGLLPFGLSTLAAVPWQTLPLWLWGWLAYIILGATVLAYTLNYAALRRAESSFVAFFIFLQPLLAASMDVWLMGSAWGWRLGLAGALISAGVAVSLLVGRRRPVTPLPRGA